MINRFALLSLALLLATSHWGLAQQKNFRKVINRVKYHDPYDPRVQEGLFVGSIQTGSHADYTTNTIERLYAGYYVTQDSQLYLVIPEFEGDYLGLGGEYRLGKTWFGVELYPDDADFHLYVRVVTYRRPTAKFHYRFGLTLYDEAKAYNIAGGYHNHPFNRSRNTFVDFKGEYRLFDADNLNASNLSLIGEIGHGWAGFADVQGLQLYGSIGLEYSSVNSSVDGPFESSFSDSDVDLRIVVGLLFKSPL